LNISIIIPIVGNRELLNTITSIVKQKLDVYEIVIVRNGIRCCNTKIRRFCVNNKVFICEIITNRKGKSNALNIGITYSRFEYICLLDADTKLNNNAISLALKELEDKIVFAVGGKIKVCCKKKSLIEQLQKYEYEKTFNLTRKLFNDMNSDFIISGAFGVFRKKDLLKIRGYDLSAVGEDMEIVMRIQELFHSQNRKFSYIKEAVCFTYVQPTLPKLLKQRDRWQRGLLDSFIKHRRMIFNPKYGCLGLIVLPYVLLFELIGPIFTVIYTIYVFVLLTLKLLFPFIININNITNFNKPFIIFFILSQFSITLVADIEEHKNKLLVIKKIPKLIFITFASIIIQIPLAFARVYGMITFHWRKMKW